MTRCLLLHPEFRSASFWNYRETCNLVGARYPAAPLGLVTVAAMLPTDWELRLVDRNVEAWDESVLEWADVVLIGGMMPQQRDALGLIHAARRHGKRVVVGGPDATSSPHLYGEADHLVLGEAEVTLPRFLRDLAGGTPEKVYDAGGEKADVTRTPCPRFDLLDFRRYLHVGVQWCRGCPFNCEFCDIIELFGRVPRAKTVPQMLHELQALYDLGYRGHVDLVDDNFIGNKKLVKAFLPHLKTWLEERHWPFEFTTEASLNLADDEALLDLMQDVGFWAVFVGIESPDEETLIGTQKRQNTNRSIVESVRTIYRHGMAVNAGYILGLDAEHGGVAEGITRCIEETAIPVNMVGLLFALPGTQLSRRLQAEGRLAAGFERAPDGAGDQGTGGLNFATLRARVDILRDFLAVVETIYEPRRYFARVREVGLALDSTRRRFRPSLRSWVRELAGFARLIRRLGLGRPTGLPFWRTIIAMALRNPRSLRYVAALIGLYVHLGPFAQLVAERIRQDIAREERSPSPCAGSASVGPAPALPEVVPSPA